METAYHTTWGLAFIADLGGVEPPTHRLTVDCSNHLSYRSISLRYYLYLSGRIYFHHYITIKAYWDFLDQSRRNETRTHTPVIPMKGLAIPSNTNYGYSSKSGRSRIRTHKAFTPNCFQDSSLIQPDYFHCCGAWRTRTSPPKGPILQTGCQIQAGFHTTLK